MDVKVISFDLDGTLVDNNFIDSIWFDEIPNLYSIKNHVPLEKAKKIVTKEYDKVGEDKIEWYDIEYWLDKFNLNYDHKKLLLENKKKVRVYPEVKNTLKKLRKNFTLAINSNCPREFLDVELSQGGLRRFFKFIFSSTSDFGQVKKSSRYFAKTCSIIGVNPRNMVHVGDNWRFDYTVPSKIGIKAVFLDRKGVSYGEYVIHSLTELEKVLNKFES